MKLSLSRRTILRGLGAAVALPTLEIMLNNHGTAYAAGGGFPRRFVVWFFGNGVLLPRWVPAATGANWQLSEQLAPLVDAARGIDVKSYVSVVSGYNVKTPNLRGHHNGVAAMLSAAPFIPLPTSTANYASKFGMISVDQVVADAVGGTNTFKSLQIAVSKRYTKGEGPTLQYLSHRSPDAPMPQTTSPATLFTQLFGNFNPGDPTDPRDKMRANVLDAVKGDADALKKKLGTKDQQRLDAHLTGISEMRTRILALPPVLTSACSKPATVTNTNADIGGVEQYEQVSSLMSDLMAMAFACDLTRVATFQFSGSVGGHCFKTLTPNDPRDNEHALTHDPAQQDKVNQAVIFTMRNFAYTLNALKKVTEGTGNLLDNSALVATSDLAEGEPHSINNYPILVAGRAGGALNGSQHIKGTGQNTSDVLLTVMKAVGSGVTSVGKDSGLSTTTVAPLLKAVPSQNDAPAL